MAEELRFVVVDLWGKPYKVQVYPNYVANFHITLNEDDTERLFGHIYRKNGTVQFVFTHSTKLDPSLDKWKKRSKLLRVRAEQADSGSNLSAWLKLNGLMGHTEQISTAVTALKRPLLQMMQ